MPLSRKATLSLERLVEVGRDALVAVARRPAASTSRSGWKTGLLGHAVDDSAAAAAAEDHRVRALQRLDALEVVEVAVVLHVVAHAVQEEVGGRAVAADDDLVAVVLALVDLDARARSASTSPTLSMSWSLDELLGGDGDRLRHVAQRASRVFVALLIASTW